MAGKRAAGSVSDVAVVDGQDVDGEAAAGEVAVEVLDVDADARLEVEADEVALRVDPVDRLEPVGELTHHAALGERLERPVEPVGSPEVEFPACGR